MRTLLSLLALCSSVILGYAGREDSTKIRFTYSPLFWKDNLHLSESQVRQIALIEIDFYEAIRKAVNHDRVLRTETIAELIQLRDLRLWCVFSRRQLVKWRRISGSFRPAHFRNTYQELVRQVRDARLLHMATWKLFP
jgi:hypothetical protein